MVKRLIVAAHADDEILSIGGSIRRWLKNGDSVHIHYMTLCDPTRSDGIDDLLKQAKVAHEILHGENVGMSFTLFKDCDFVNEPQSKLVEAIESQIKEFKPGYVYTHHSNDVNPDHCCTSKACDQAVLLPQRRCTPYIKGYYKFEVPSSTNWGIQSGFKPNKYIEVSGDDLSCKYKSLNSMKSVIKGDNHPRGFGYITALAQVRGATVGLYFAEALETIWEVE